MRSHPSRLRIVGCISACMRGGIGRRYGGWQLSLGTCRLGSRQGHEAFRQLQSRVSIGPSDHFGQNYLRGRGACRRFGISSWEATSFALKAVQANWRAIVTREDVQPAMRIERPRGFAAPSFVAMLMVPSRSTSRSSCKRKW